MQSLEPHSPTHFVEPTSEPLFSYLLVLDFEATCQQNTKLLPCSQIIQLPVRVIELPSNTLLTDTFHYYIKPTFNPKLTPFCTKLTGITQQTVDAGIPLEQSLAFFHEWVSKYDNWIFVTCGNWDLNTCLKAEAWEKKLELKQYWRKFLNIKELFPAPEGWKGKGKYRARGMTDMLDSLGLELEGRHHSGIDDTLNIARVVVELLQRGKLELKKEHIHHVNHN